MVTELERIRAKQFATEHGYPIHVGCGGECEIRGTAWFCHGCERNVGDVAGPGVLSMGESRLLLDEHDRFRELLRAWVEAEIVAVGSDHTTREGVARLNLLQAARDAAFEAVEVDLKKGGS